MRTVHTFVLKVIRDSAEPEVLQGMVTAVASGNQSSFTDGAALLNLLLQISATHDSGRGLGLQRPACDLERSEPSPGR